MHDVLTIPELVVKIIEQIDSQEDLYSLARVCRSFACLALEALWREWPVPLEGLLSLFPDDLWELSPQVCVFIH